MDDCELCVHLYKIYESYETDGREYGCKKGGCSQGTCPDFTPIDLRKKVEEQDAFIKEIFKQLTLSKICYKPECQKLEQRAESAEMSVKEAQEIIAELKDRCEKLQDENMSLRCCSNCQKSKLHEVCNYRYQEFDCKKDDYREWEMAE